MHMHMHGCRNSHPGFPERGTYIYLDGRPGHDGKNSAELCIPRPSVDVIIMLISNLNCVSLLLAAAVSTSAQTLPVIDLVKSVHRAQLNVSGTFDKNINPNQFC